MLNALDDFQIINLISKTTEVVRFFMKNRDISFLKCINRDLRFFFYINVCYPLSQNH